MSSTYDLQINQGETFSLSLSLKDTNDVPLNLSGCAVSGQIRFRYGDSGYLMSLSPVITNVASGLIQLTLPATGTSALPITIGVYDIEIYNTGNDTVIKALAGNAYIYPEATR